MKRFRSTLATGVLIALASSASPGLAQETRQMKGVIEKMDISAERMVVRETHGHMRTLPLMLDSTTKIVTPSGATSLAALHVGDQIRVSYGAGPKGEVAKQVEVTKPAP